MLSSPSVKILLVAINAKYVQTNLAVRLLKAYAARHAAAVRDGSASVEIGEWNVNQPLGAIVRGIYATGADAILFSTYAWNRDMVFRAASDVRQVLPKAVIGFGGPEVSWAPERAFAECPAADVILAGEGEATFAAFADRAAEVFLSRGWTMGDAGNPFADIAGLYARARIGHGGARAADAIDGADGTAGAGDILFGGTRPLIEDLDEIAFPFGPDSLNFDPEHRIVYYESSRGCPFRCAYCLSALDTRVRYYPLDRVLREIAYFMEAGFPLVKFVDRTFNLDPARFLAIWAFIRDHHNGKTLFHFEIAAEYLPDEAFSLLESMPSGAIQFEIGIQSANAETLRLVGRPAHIEELAGKIKRIPRHIHTHVDLIAGLPAEDLASFAASFDFAFALGADMLQLGFLKVLPGAPMEALARGMDGYRWSATPPYEVLSSPSLVYGDLVALKEVESLLDAWYNAGLMRNALGRLCGGDESPFAVFRSLVAFARGFFPDHDPFLPRKPVDAYACAAAYLAGRGATEALEWLRYDFLLQGKPGSFPPWFVRRYSKEAHDAALESSGILERPGAHRLSRREGYARTEYERFAFGADGGETAILFTYPAERGGSAGTACITL
ncbi:MAG TPA: DUF4080 domain-containing protein [Treponemataceae bacterium]|nr:DUF4080 domain-containing protein [Treponemataceae bacterium]